MFSVFFEAYAFLMVAIHADHNLDPQVLCKLSEICPVFSKIGIVGRKNHCTKGGKSLERYFQCWAFRNKMSRKTQCMKPTWLHLGSCRQLDTQRAR